MSNATAHIDYKMLYEQLQPAYLQLLKGFEQQQQSNQQLLQSNQQLQHQLMQLQHQLQQLSKLVGGFKSERFVPNSTSNSQKELGLLFEEAAPSTSLETVQKITYTRQQPKPKADQSTENKLPEHLRREVTIIEPAEAVSDCEKVGEEVRETLNWQPGEIFVTRIVRPVYRCSVAGDKPGKERIVMADAPARAIPRTIAEPALLAQVTVDKFVDHKPLNRQLETFKRNGVIIPYSTIADWIKLVANAIEPIGNILLKEMLKSAYWQADETGISVLDDTKKKSTHKGYYWTYLTGDGKLIYYDYQPGRDAERPREVLQHFKGHLQTDGYSAYESLGMNAIQVFFCMAHARRKYFDSQSNDQARSEHALTEIGKLYEIEAACKELQLNETEVLQKRQQEALPILNALGEWMKREYLLLKPKSPIAKAMAYSIKRWDMLSLYATTSHLQIDNNAIERCMKNLAVGRKNYLFCGSHEAAKRAGVLYSLLVTCKLNDVNPYEWLKDVLNRNINEMPINKVKDLLPHNWKQMQESITQ